MTRKRIALCFSGQLRNIDEGFKHIQKNVLEPNRENWDIDVFVHTWLAQEDIGKPYIAANGSVASVPVARDSLAQIYEYYNPQKMLVEKQIKFDEKNFGQRKATMIVPWFSLSKCYSMQKSIELKKKHEEETLVSYDLVMTMRFDLAIVAPVVFDNFDPGAVNTSTHGVCDGIGVDVTHSIMSSKNADVYGSILDHVENYYNDGVLFCDEHFFHRHLDHHHIKINRTFLLNNYALIRV